jgi:hypothetical protein
MTNGALCCPFCDSRELPVWRAYVPYISKEYQRRFVLISEDYLPLVKELKPGNQIRISRAVSSRAACCVESHVWRATPLPDALLATIPVDILPALWRCWGDQELLAWHQRDEAASAAPLVTPGRVFTPPADEAAARAAGEAELEKVANRLRGRFKVSDIAASIGSDPHDKPHANGKPKPK